MTSENSDRNFNEERYAQIRNETDLVRGDQRIRAVLDLMRPFRGAKLLDVGCTDGFLSALFREEGFYTIGVDASPSAVERAKSRCHEAFVGDLDKPPLPFQDAIMDLVFAGEVIEHVFRTEEFLEELRRVTKPGGHLILTTPNLAWWLNRLVLMVGWQPFFSEVGTRPSNTGNPLRSKALTPAGHIRLFTASSLKNLLQRSGWRVEALRGAGLVERQPLRTFNKVISRWFPSLASDLIVLCRRE